MVLGITGSGLQPTSEIGHLGNVPQESLEDHEGLDDHIHPNQWSKFLFLWWCNIFCILRENRYILEILPLLCFFAFNQESTYQAVWKRLSWCLRSLSNGTFFELKELWPSGSLRLAVNFFSMSCPLHDECKYIFKTESGYISPNVLSLFWKFEQIDFTQYRWINEEVCCLSYLVCCCIEVTDTITYRKECCYTFALVFVTRIWSVIDLNVNEG